MTSTFKFKPEIWVNAPNAVVARNNLLRILAAAELERAIGSFAADFGEKVK